MAKKDKEDTHRQAMARFDRVSTDEREARDLAVEDAMFAQVAGKQWDDVATNARSDRPRFEINKIALPINQAIGDQRQSEISSKIRPVSSGATEDIADTYTALIRHIERLSRFDKVQDNSFKEVANGGMGGWYITTEFSDDDSFEQDIVIKKITSAATSVYMDPAAKDENKRDAMWGFVVEEMAQESFKAKWPDAVVSDVSTNNQAESYYTGWRTQDTVRVADYWVVEPITKEIALMTDGTVIELNDETESILDELAEKDITIAKDAKGNDKTKKVKSRKIVHYKISGAEILEGPNDWAGKFIPIPVWYGYNIWINNIHYWRGMVRFAKDPNRVYNYATSGAIEATALSPKDPFWLTAKQAKGHERQFETFNVKNQPFMLYNSDIESPGPPQRSGAPAVQTALIQQISQADADIQATTGRFAPSLGDNPADQSGKALLAVQQQGEAGTFELSDNLAGAVEYTAEILLDLIPKIYDTERQIRILNPDGSSEVLEINKTILDEETNKKVIVNDLSLGKYSVATDTGPSYKTKRTEALNFLNALTQSSEIFAQLAPDLLAKNVDFEFNDELTKRVRNVMISQGTIQPTEEEQQEAAENQPPPQPPSILEQMSLKQAQLQLESLAADIDLKELEHDKLRAEIQNKMADTQNKLADVGNTRVDTAEKLMESGASIPVVPGELEAQSGNIDEFNSMFEESMINSMTEPGDIPKE